MTLSTRISYRASRRIITSLDLPLRHSPSRPSTVRYASSKSSADSKSSSDEATSSTKPSEEAQVVTKKKTQAELDRDLQLKMQGIAGDGGDAGIEYEDGQPVAMKRSVKNNMFRYI